MKMKNWLKNILELLRKLNKGEDEEEIGKFKVQMMKIISILVHNQNFMEIKEIVVMVMEVKDNNRQGRAGDIMEKIEVWEIIFNKKDEYNLSL